jgi:glucosamine-phosphate N-acetyltransferase
MGIIIIGVLHDLSNNTIKIIASGTLIIEPKIIRGGKNVGHIEDIVVSENMRGKGISQELLNMLKIFARENNCYKVILDCNNEVKNVYIKNGLGVKGIQMAEYFT